MIVSEKKQSLCSGRDVFECMKAILNMERDGNVMQEHFWAISVNTKNVVQYIELVSLGSLSASIVHPRELFRLAIIKSSAALLLCHNHPSGDTRPSQDDILLTRRLVQAGEILGIKILDHVIIGESYFSFRDNGLLTPTA